MMANLRNLAISALRLAGHTGIATGRRAITRHVARPLALLAARALSVDSRSRSMTPWSPRGKAGLLSTPATRRHAILSPG
jgi:hypothetical protein